MQSDREHSCSTSTAVLQNYFTACKVFGHPYILNGAGIAGCVALPPLIMKAATCQMHKQGNGGKT